VLILATAIAGQCLYVRNERKTSRM